MKTVLFTYDVEEILNGTGGEYSYLKYLSTKFLFDNEENL